LQPLVKSSGVISECAPSVAYRAWCDWPRLSAHLSCRVVSGRSPPKWSRAPAQR